MPRRLLALALTLAGTFALPAKADPSAWTDLPQEQDIPLCAGATYNVLASVSNDFSKADILAKAPACVEVVRFLERPPNMESDPDPDHRYVSATFVVHGDGETLPWKSPWPLTIFHLVRASTESGSGPPCPAPPIGKRRWPWVVGSLLGVLAFGGLGWGWMHRVRAKR